MHCGVAIVKTGVFGTFLTNPSVRPADLGVRVRLYEVCGTAASTMYPLIDFTERVLVMGPTFKRQ